MLRSDLAPSTAAPRRRRCSAARGLSPAGQLPGREPRTNGQTAASQRSSGATVRAYVPARHRRPGSGILRLHRARGKVPVGQTLPDGDGRVASDWRGSQSVIRSQGLVEPCRIFLRLVLRPPWAASVCRCPSSGAPDELNDASPNLPDCDGLSLGPYGHDRILRALMSLAGSAGPTISALIDGRLAASRPAATGTRDGVVRPPKPHSACL